MSDLRQRQETRDGKPRLSRVLNFASRSHVRIAGAAAVIVGALLLCDGPVPLPLLCPNCTPSLFGLFLPAVGATFLGGMAVIWFLQKHRECEPNANLNDSDRQNPDKDSERLSSVIESLGEGVLEFDDKAVVCWSNQRTGQYIGESAVGKSLQDIAERFSSGASDFVESIADIAFGRNDAILQGTVTCPNGKETKYLSWMASPLVRAGCHRGAVVTFCDTTSRTELELALTKQRSDFVAALKHRMRTPIIAAIRIHRLFLQEEFGPLSSQQTKVISAVLKDQENLLYLIDLMEDIYAYQNQTKILCIEDVAIARLFDELRAEFEIRCDGRLSLTFAIAGDNLTVTADKEEIKKLLWNLLDNAVKHARSSIRLKAGLSADEDAIEVTVEDDGKGISPGDISWLFDRFYEVSSEGKYPPATGCGLCLCAQIARAHRGTIACSSNPGRGTTFKVTIPKPPVSS